MSPCGSGGAFVCLSDSFSLPLSGLLSSIFFLSLFFFLTECIFALWTSWKELPFVNSWLQQQFFIPGWQCTLKPTDRACLEKGNSSVLKPETRSERPASDLPSKCNRALKFYWKRDAYVWHRHSINVCWVECSKNDKGDITEYIFFKTSFHVLEGVFDILPTSLAAAQCLAPLIEFLMLPCYESPAAALGPRLVFDYLILMCVWGGSGLTLEQPLECPY